MSKTTQLITRDYNGMSFTFREDGYFNMTKAAQHFGKEVKEFLRLPSTLEYIEAVEENVGFSHLLDIKPGRNGGTWGAPKLAVFFARWLDVRFAVWCDSVIEDILKGNADLTITKPEVSAVNQVESIIGTPSIMEAITMFMQASTSEIKKLNKEVQQVTQQIEEVKNDLEFSKDYCVCVPDCVPIF